MVEVQGNDPCCASLQRMAVALYIPPKNYGEATRPVQGRTEPWLLRTDIQFASEATQCRLLSLLPLVESEGIEPSLTRCQHVVLPLDDDPKIQNLIPSFSGFLDDSNHCLIACGLLLTPPRSVVTTSSCCDTCDASRAGKARSAQRSSGRYGTIDTWATSFR